MEYETTAIFPADVGGEVLTVLGLSAGVGHRAENRKFVQIELLESHHQKKDVCPRLC